MLATLFGLLHVLNVIVLGLLGTFFLMEDGSTLMPMLLSMVPGCIMLTLWRVASSLWSAVLRKIPDAYHHTLQRLVELFSTMIRTNPWNTLLLIMTSLNTAFIIEFSCAPGFLNMLMMFFLRRISRPAISFVSGWIFGKLVNRLGLACLEERRRDPVVNNRALTFREMRAAHASENLTERQALARWQNLEKADSLGGISSAAACIWLSTRLAASVAAFATPEVFEEPEGERHR